MTSLPPEVPPRLRNIAHVVSAYNICLILEKSLQEAENEGRNIGRDLIYIRIVGYLVHYVPTDRGLRTVVYEISSSADNSALLQVGKMYYDHYIRAFRANKGPTPIPSNHASRPSFDTIADMINDTLSESPLSHAGAKRKALIRDGHRCVVTRKYDGSSVASIRELGAKFAADPSMRIVPTQCAHIFSESTNMSFERLSQIMNRFGHEKLFDELNGPLIHRLENVMTVSIDFHTLFDSFKIWFVPTNEVNKYTLDSPLDGGYARDYPKYVTFTTPDPVEYPIPSRDYLEIHAACAKVAHLSGAGECIDKFYRDMEDKQTLDPDGGSADMLEHAIFGLQDTV